ncbi:MAG: hypothetical protein IPH35_16810 [Rhodoferax sp.]|nr:hypothetical protein [Rhodoferax sp.]
MAANFSFNSRARWHRHSRFHIDRLVCGVGRSAPNPANRPEVEVINTLAAGGKIEDDVITKIRLDLDRFIAGRSCGSRTRIKVVLRTMMSLPVPGVIRLSVVLVLAAPVTLTKPSVAMTVL